MTKSAINKSKHILTYKRGSQILLVAGPRLRPLYVPHGGGYVQRFIEEAHALGNRAELIKSYPEEEALLTTLIEHGILEENFENSETEQALQAQVSCEDNEAQDEQETLKTVGMRNFNSLSLFMLLTQFCNQNCVYCLNGEATYEKAARRKMDRETAFRGLDYFAKRIKPEGTLNIVLFGGEPLLNWSLAKNIITYTQDHLRKKYEDINFQFHCTTNLTVFPPDLIEWALKQNITFLVNIDGPKRIHDTTRPLFEGGSSFDRTVNNLRKLRAEGLKYELRATVTSYNQNDLIEVAELHRDLGCQASAMIPVIPVTSDEYILPNTLLPDPDNVASRMAEIIEKNVWPWESSYQGGQIGRRIISGSSLRWPCGAVFGGTPVLDVNGDVYACIYMVGMARFKTGNVCYFDKEYPDEAVVSFMRSQIDAALTENCDECSMIRLCAGGCPVGTLVMASNKLVDSNTLNYWQRMNCAMQEALLEAVLWKIGEGKWSDIKDHSPETTRMCL